MGKLGDFLIIYSGKSGIIHTEFPQVANVLELYGKAKRLGVERVSLDGEIYREYYKLEVPDLLPGYRIAISAYMQIWE